jgi:hypothetical protein
VYAIELLPLDKKIGMYLIGYFEVEIAGEARKLRTKPMFSRLFRGNQHVRYHTKDKFLEDCKNPTSPLFLVRGRKNGSRLLCHGKLITRLRMKYSSKNRKQPHYYLTEFGKMQAHPA